MKLNFSGAPEVDAPLAEVWPRILDPHFVGRHGPGVESVEVLDATHFKVITGFGVGAIKVRFGIDVELIEVNPPTGLTMTARGKAPGSAVEVTAALALEVIDAARTRMTWTAETLVHGAVASVGARLMEGTARKLSEQFWNRFAASIAESARAGVSIPVLTPEEAAARAAASPKAEPPGEPKPSSTA